MTVYFTSITPNYIAKARVLCKSLKAHNPGAYFVLGLCDAASVDAKLLDEPFDDVLTFEELDAITDKQSFLFKHTVTELCTAVKPYMAEALLKREGIGSVIYLDPDIGVFSTLVSLSEYLQQYSILLTPHQLAPEREDLYVRENEILFLKRGSYNFGFFGVKGDAQGLDFLHWWQARVGVYCFDDDYEVLPELTADGLLGLFTDQKWADLVPSFFDNHFIIRDPGCNVCTWNLSNRHIQIQKDGTYTVNSYPLRFFHFSGYDSGGHLNELKKSLSYYPNNADVLLLNDWYGKQLQQEGQEYYGNLKYSLTKYDNGDPIRSFERKIYHIRKDVHTLFGSPFKVTRAEPCFYHWVRLEYPDYFGSQEAIAHRQQEVEAVAALNRLLPRGTRRRAFIVSIAKRFKPGKR